MIGSNGQNGQPRGRQKDLEDLAAMLSAALTLWIMVYTWDAYFDMLLRYLEARVSAEVAYVVTLATYVLGVGIAYKAFKIVLGAILVGTLLNTMRGGSPFGVLGF